MYSHPNKNKNKSQPNGRNSGLCNLTEVNGPRFHLYYIKFPAKLFIFAGVHMADVTQMTEVVQKLCG